MVTGLYPGSFDPITNGHLDIVVRAASVLDRLVVAVYDAPPKDILFSTQERVALVRQAVKSLPNVEVQAYTGLTVVVARQVRAQVVVRGLRAGSDFENEFEMAMMNKKLAPDIESLFLMSDSAWHFLSSSRVKEVASLGGDITSLVPPHVATLLRERLQKLAR